jgi:FkbH-like protein
MFQFEFGDKTRWERLDPGPATFRSRLCAEDVTSVVALRWEEHCLECAAPQCFKDCDLYARRGDGNCARFEYGITPNPRFTGLLPHGADIRFRRWGKLETAIFPARLTPRAHSAVNAREVQLARGVHMLSTVVEGRRRRHRVENAYNLARRGLFHRLPSRDAAVDEFIIECWSFHDRSFHLVVEEMSDGLTIFRDAVPISPGPNYHTISADAFTLSVSRSKSLPRLLVYPEDDEEARVVFTWLDFVRYARLARPVSEAGDAPAPKVKCVAWDLDNTLWTGTLIEDGADRCDPRAEMIEVVRALDERGILQTVVSKNDHDAAWSVLQDAGIADYFLYPAINWGSKSENLKQIATRLNIGLDTFAFVDDSQFERSEVRKALPMIRVYADTEIADALRARQFDVSVSAESRERRRSYLDNMKREQVLARFSGDYLDFLRSCGLVVNIFTPDNEAQRARCLELVHRSNQLNLSTQRYSAEEFAALFSDPTTRGLAIECHDHFGAYGIVGFATVVDSPSDATVKDLVLSCRVARKRVEHSFFRWLANEVVQRGGSTLRATFVPTERNGPLSEVLTDLHFVPSADGFLEVAARDAAATDEVNEVVIGNAPSTAG